MADLILNIPTGEVALTAATAKTVFSMTAPANQRLKLKGIELFFKGTSATDTPVKCELSLVTTEGAAIATTATPAKNDNDMAETAQGVYKTNYTSEPSTYGANLRTWEVHPQTGLVLYFPLHDEPRLKGGTEMALRLTAAQAQTVSVNAIVEE